MTTNDQVRDCVVDLLQKQARNWQVQRCQMIVLGIMMCALYFILTAPVQISVGGLAILTGVWSIIHGIRTWRIDPQLELLLQLHEDLRRIESMEMASDQSIG